MRSPLKATATSQPFSYRGEKHAKKHMDNIGECLVMSGKVPESFSMERKHMTEEMKMSENLPGGQRTAA